MNKQRWHFCHLFFIVKLYRVDQVIEREFMKGCTTAGVFLS